jgi:hypothetical protein
MITKEYENITVLFLLLPFILPTLRSPVGILSIPLDRRPVYTAGSVPAYCSEME